VEWLRVRNCLRIYAIVLGALLLIGGIVRISVNGQLSNDQFFIDRVSKEPGTKISHSTVDGLSRTTMYSPSDKTTITIDTKADGGKVIRITEPAKGHNTEETNKAGSFDISDTVKNGTETTTINTDAPTNVVTLLAMASFAALIIATIFGGALSCETGGHLEIALLKPVTRTRYALGIMGADAVGILVAMVLAIAAALIGQSMFEVPHLDFNGLISPETALLILVPFAWYAALNAATVSLRRGTGGIIGFSWPIGFVLIALSQIPLGDSPTGQVFHTIFWSVSRISPLTYGVWSFHDGNPSGMTDMTYSIRIAIVCGLLLIYGALTLVQWRRVEA
jgi:hypothetical protein